MCPQSAHLMSMACISKHSMCHVSPVSPGGHHTWTSCTSSHSRRSGSPVSLGSHYMNHIKINPFSDVSSPPWALGASSNQCHIHLAAQCTICPHCAPRATRLQHHLHLAISDVLDFMWAIGATIWTTSRSIHFQTFFVPKWAIRAILYQRHVLLMVQYAMCPHWAPGLHTSSSCKSSHSGCSGSRWAVGVIVWAMSKSSNFQKLCVHNERWEAFYINAMYIKPLNTLCVPSEPSETAHHAYVDLAILGLFCPHRAVGSTTPWTTYIDLCISWHSHAVCL